MVSLGRFRGWDGNQKKAGDSGLSRLMPAVSWDLPEDVGSSASMWLSTWLVWAASKPGGRVERENPREPGGKCAVFKNLHLH